MIWAFSRTNAAPEILSLLKGVFVIGGMGLKTVMSPQGQGDCPLVDGLSRILRAKQSMQMMCLHGRI
jgi:hypothetical protein